MAVPHPELLAHMTIHAPDGIVIVDSEGIIEFWNSGSERIFGWKESEVLGQSLDLIIPERHRRPHWKGFHAAMAKGSTHYGASDLLTVPALKADGSSLSIEFSVCLLPDPQGGTGHVGAVIRDVTARRAQEKELRRRLADANAGATTL
ncbi:PAS domain-containing protein [Streptomyces sp. NBC_01361]|uniref:PAS domain-containing protein n=1 Tax=Streptomyces sp. NBC_01361 TaxID=2903838 RepID=UPI002E2F5266|nr:PAS domain S-box protein [Streptomyces sp. NBC_01361]